MSEEYEDEIQIWEGDYGTDLEMECSIKGVVFNLTGYTLKLRVTDASFGTLKIDATATITDAVNGLCKYTIQLNDFNQPNKLYHAAIVATKTGKEVTFGDLKIRVRKKPPKVS